MRNIIWEKVLRRVTDGKCPCGERVAPVGAVRLWPDHQPDPDNAERRWVRAGRTSTFVQRGSMVNHYLDCTPPREWHLIRRCYLSHWHAVTPAILLGDGTWTVGGSAVTWRAVA
jgi:hypothetical protein